MKDSTRSENGSSPESNEWVLLQDADAADLAHADESIPEAPRADAHEPSAVLATDSASESQSAAWVIPYPSEPTASELAIETAVPTESTQAANTSAVQSSAIEPTVEFAEAGIAREEIAETVALAPPPVTDSVESNTPSVVTAVVVSDSSSTQVEPTAASPSHNKPQSWLFRFLGFASRSIEFSFGLASMVVLLAVVTGFPLLQVLVLGYLLEASARIAKSGKLSQCLPGWRRAARLGSLAMGTAMCLGPIGYLSSLSEAAALVDPNGPAEVRLRIGTLFVACLLVPHMLAAWFCGGKLRYFFWPLLAPFQLAIWMLQWGLASKPIRSALDETIGKLWPALVHDLCQVTPITDFFLPAIIFKHVWRGTLWSHMRDGFWDFVAGMKPLYLGWLGIRALVGSIAWLALPTMLLIGGTVLPEGAALLAGTLGVVLLGIVCLYLPTQQTHFAVVGKLYAMFDWAAARDQILRSPIRHTLAMVIVLALAIPLYLFKIELIDPDLWWSLGLFFIAFSLPARWALGWAYARSSRREKRTWFLWRFPIRTLALAPALVFALFVSVTRFLSWGGVSGLFEHHAFLIPAPFTFPF